MKTVPLFDCLRSSSAVLQNEYSCEDTASPKAPKQWRSQMKREATFITALPVGAGRLASSGMHDPPELSADDATFSENRATASRHFRWSYLSPAVKGICSGGVMTIVGFD